MLVGGRSTLEDAYAYAKFARVVLGTNDIDFRIRPHSAEEADFLAARHRVTTTYRDLENAPTVLLVGFEPEEESPIVYLRLRKAARQGALVVQSIAPYASRGLAKMSGRLLQTVPGGEAAALDSLRESELLRAAGAVIMVGERLAAVPGALSAAIRLADRTGARLVWVPRRAGDRGALEAGALPQLLPGGRPVTDDAARGQVAQAWGLTDLPATRGRDSADILAAARDGRIGALVVGGVEPGDMADPRAALAAIEAAGFVVSLELRRSEVTERADVVFPVAPVAEKPGTFLNWEGRPRIFDAALPGIGAMPDQRVLDAIADRMGTTLGLPDAAAARAELARLGPWDGVPPAAPDLAPAEPTPPGPCEAVLAGWRMLLDSGRMQDGEPHLAGTARTPVLRLSATTAAEIGSAEGDPVTVSTERGSITLPLAITDLPDRVVWLPLNSPGSAVFRELAALPGALVRIHSAATGMER